MKKVKVPRFTHTSTKKKGMGDYYGSGVKNPMGRSIDVFAEKPSKNKDLGKPPKSLA